MKYTLGFIFLDDDLQRTKSRCQDSPLWVFWIGFMVYPFAILIFERSNYRVLSWNSQNSVGDHRGWMLLCVNVRFGFCKDEQIILQRPSTNWEPLDIYLQEFFVHFAIIYQLSICNVIIMWNDCQTWREIGILRSYRDIFYYFIILLIID